MCAPTARRPWSLILQTHAEKKALETGVGTQTIKQKVRFEEPRHVQRLLRVCFLQELESFVVFAKASIYGGQLVRRNRGLFRFPLQITKDLLPFGFFARD